MPASSRTAPSPVEYTLLNRYPDSEFSSTVRSGRIPDLEKLGFRGAFRSGYLRGIAEEFRGLRGGRSVSEPAQATCFPGADGTSSTGRGRHRALVGSCSWRLLFVVAIQGLPHLPIYVLPSGATSNMRSPPSYLLRCAVPWHHSEARSDQSQLIKYAGRVF